MGTISVAECLEGKKACFFYDVHRGGWRKGKGFFLVLGPDGAGKGSFLDAAASLLSLNECKLIKVSGNRADLQSFYPAIAASLRCERSGDTVIDALYSYTGASMSLGVFLEDMHLIDSTSINDVMKFYSIYPGRMVVTDSIERSIMNQGSDFGGVSASIRLGPISQEDCRVWFRAVLMWKILRRIFWSGFTVKQEVFQDCLPRVSDTSKEGATWYAPAAVTG
jgi:hypothetical protein